MSALLMAQKAKGGGPSLGGPRTGPSAHRSQAPCCLHGMERLGSYAHALHVAPEAPWPRSARQRTHKGCAPIEQATLRI